jgi:anaerobic magnesium-protoporphyrin IX monomethyl ester cyclase
LSAQGPGRASAVSVPLVSVLLLNAPGGAGSTPNREGAAGLGALSEGGGFVYPPQTLAVCAAVLREAGFAVQCLDALAAGLDLAQTGERLASARPAIVGLLASALTLELDLATLRALQGAYPAARYLLFGPALRLDIIQLPADLPAVALRGEPEGMIAAACARLAREEAPAGTCWTPADLGLAATMPAGLVVDLDTLPFPAWDLLDRACYPFLTVQASRGCDGACRYCPYVAAQGRAFRGRAPERVLAELRWLRREFAPTRIVFRDPAFACDRERVVALCEGISGDPALYPGRGDAFWWWECESHPEHVDRDLVRQMARAGCRGLKLGLETVDAALLALWGRTGAEALGLPLGTEQQLLAAEGYLRHVLDLIEECRQQGVACRLFVMAGVPGETEAAVAQTAAFLRGARPAGAHVKLWVDYPGVDWAGRPALPTVAEREAHYAALKQAAAEATAAARPSGLRRLLRALRRRI